MTESRMNPVANPLFQYLPFLAILAPVAMFWGQVKTIIGKVFSTLVVKVEFIDLGYTVFNGYLNRNFRRYRLGQSNYDAFQDYTTVDKRQMAIGFEDSPTLPQVYRRGRTLICVKKTLTKDRPDMLTVYSFRWTFDAESHYVQALKEYNNGKSEKRSFKVYYKYGTNGKASSFANGLAEQKSPNAFAQSEGRHLSNRIIGYSMDQIGYRDKTNINRGYVFSADAESLVYECKRWRASENWYKDRGILWRRGAMLVGPPGTGKSSLVRKICQTIDVPLFIFDLASMSNAEMIEAWKDVQGYSPCAVIFDDIDRVFEGSVNVAKNGGGLTLECLLSCLSGALPAEGVLVFGTANDPTKLDPALGVVVDGQASRPGRFDVIVTLGSMTREDRLRLATMILDGLTVDVAAIVEKGEGMTAAQFNDHCASIAVELYWKDRREVERVGEHPAQAIKEWKVQPWSPGDGVEGVTYSPVTGLEALEWRGAEKAWLSSAQQGLADRIMQEAPQ